MLPSARPTESNGDTASHACLWVDDTAGTIWHERSTAGHTPSIRSLFLASTRASEPLNVSRGTLTHSYPHFRSLHIRKEVSKNPPAEPLASQVLLPEAMVHRRFHFVGALSRHRPEGSDEL